MKKNDNKVSNFWKGMYIGVATGAIIMLIFLLK
ncbi:hypothetical protein CCAN2_1580006 [Capnocytophaga canimorsus]|nr:hypothetical protein CCAN2_1580006 [Capnocytophaga canimorsus]